MEFILITDSKLKVMLTKSDLDEFDIKAEELDYSNTETKRMFWDIIGRAKKCVGFTCDGMQVLVQLYASRDGGCEMFVSKLGSSLLPQSNASQPDLRYKPLYKRNHDMQKTGAFGFDSLEWMICVCKRLCNIGYSGESSAYIDDNRRFYLFLDGLDEGGYLPYDEYSFINEYGTPENTEATLSFLNEHGKIIRLGDAVEILSTL